MLEILSSATDIVASVLKVIVWIIAMLVGIRGGRFLFEEIELKFKYREYWGRILIDSLIVASITTIIIIGVMYFVNDDPLEAFLIGALLIIDIIVTMVVNVRYVYKRVWKKLEDNRAKGDTITILLFAIGINLGFILVSISVVEYMLNVIQKGSLELFLSILVALIFVFLAFEVIILLLSLLMSGRIQPKYNQATIVFTDGKRERIPYIKRRIIYKDILLFEYNKTKDNDDIRWYKHEINRHEVKEMLFYRVEDGESHKEEKPHFVDRIIGYFAKKGKDIKTDPKASEKEEARAKGAESREI